MHDTKWSLLTSCLNVGFDRRHVNSSNLAYVKSVSDVIPNPSGDKTSPVGSGVAQKPEKCWPYAFYEGKYGFAADGQCEANIRNEDLNVGIEGLVQAKRGDVGVVGKLTSTNSGKRTRKELEDVTNLKAGVNVGTLSKILNYVVLCLNCL